MGVYSCCFAHGIGGWRMTDSPTSALGAATNSKPSGALSKARGDMLVEKFMTWFKEQVRLGVEAYTVDGPAFGQAADPNPYNVYQRLLAAQAAGLPEYWDVPAAQADLAALAQQFGPPPQQVTPPYGVPIANNPMRQEKATYEAQQVGGDLGYASPQVAPLP